MSGWVIGSQVALWVLVILMASAVWVLARQVGLLARRLPPQGAREGSAGPAIGATAPVVSEVALTGETVTFGGPSQRRTLLMFVSAGCSSCSRLAPALESVSRAERRTTDTVLVSLSDREITSAFVHQHSLDRIPTIASYELAMALGVTVAPYGIAINEEGVVTGKGLVNQVDQLESLIDSFTLFHEHDDHDHHDEHDHDHDHQRHEDDPGTDAKEETLVRLR